MVRLTAVLDANVLYSAGLRDLLLLLADRYLFAPLWSAGTRCQDVDEYQGKRRLQLIISDYFPV